jgi:myo-inositol catabolism protein IolC
MNHSAPVAFLFDVDNTLQDPAVRWQGNTIWREASVAAMAERYRGWVDLFERVCRGEWRGASAP